MNCEPVILAAGLGTRMKSQMPKVLHPLGGKPMLAWSIEVALEATENYPTIVIGPEMADVKDQFGDGPRFVMQIERLGTGHAVMQTASVLRESSGLVLILYADMPLIKPSSLRSLIEVQRTNEGPIAILTATPHKTRAFGRVLRDKSGAIVGILEEVLANDSQREISEVNVGVYCVRSDWLWDQLEKLPISPGGEYFLTDLVGMAVEGGHRIASVEIEDEDEIIGINNRIHLADAEKAIRERINERWMVSGVSMADPSSVYIGPDVELGSDSMILPNTSITGQSKIGMNCIIGPNSVIHDANIGDDCQITMSVIRSATLEDHVHIGPFAHLRPGAYLSRGVHMGNFGEVKQSRLGPGVRMGHFSYVGDSEIGAGTNIGAGTVTCNYDGTAKHKTVVGKDAFIGSATMLVAPLTLGDRARTGAGSVVTKDVAKDTLVAGVPARAIRKLTSGE
jgi:bifunctional UDP-N-acetylglucosamine pyrophosphorylase/glucosamine-1-phosphate N-acetyltransferase